MGGGRAERRWATLSALAAAVFLGALDQTVVVTALPAVIADLDVPFNRLNDAAWIVTAYLLGYTVAMPLVGRLSDVFGRQQVLVACLALLGLTSILCGAARSLEWLIVARGAQAIGGGALLPITLAVVGDLFPSERRAVLLGLIAATAEAGGVLGPLWGAVVLDHASWRWVFYANVPAIVGIALVLWRAPAPSVRTPQAVDYLGAALLGLGLGALALGLSRETSQGVAVRVSLGIAAAALLGAFAWHERRAIQPLIEVPLFRRLPFGAANALSLLSGVALIVAMVDVPLYSATILQRSAVDGGLLLMRLMVGIPIGALLGGGLMRRLGAAVTAGAGVVAAAAGLALLARWQPLTNLDDLTGALALGGIGFGLQLAPITSVVVGWAGPARAGVASALATVMRMVGMLVGIAALTSWGLDRFSALVADLPLPLPVLGEAAEVSQARLDAYQQAVIEAGVSVFSATFTAAAVVCIVALVPALFLRLPPRTAYG